VASLYVDRSGILWIGTLGDGLDRFDPSTAVRAGRLITAQETERSRIARELHDDINQQLAALAIAHSSLKRRLPAGDRDLHDELAQLQQQAVSLTEAVRRLSHELHPGVLQHAGLVAALRAHCAEFARQHGLAVTFRANDSLGRLPEDVTLCLYRVAQEALHNIAAYAQARHVEAALTRGAAGLELMIRDDGRGFDPAAARRHGGLGLVSMDERARLVRGTVEIASRLGQGTELRVHVPFETDPASQKAPVDAPMASGSYSEMIAEAPGGHTARP
jgi:two-component system sensor histidine kinase UhpB